MVVGLRPLISPRNISNYGSFVNSFEFVSDLDQPGPCSFIRLEMAALRSLFVQIGGLKRIAIKVWNQVTPEYLRTLYESMPRRMNAVIEAQGGHTKY